ncbi:MAG: recombinase family protein [Nostoc sp. NMS7]|uniref:recombinase family protein n=1 Tax=Nostoc sp. NMS7 TaxID=2815391 RepID=UPI0025CCB0BC|nr:recombinase family protein [Nostoc sp. NMS7]MBN3951584.1 recombinase family protein [Nostoc sp. NMS7]
MATVKKSKNIDTNTVVIYCRVSTDQQEKSGLGMEAQLDLCRKVAQQLELEIIGEFQETISGKVDPKERPIFLQCLALAQENGSKIMVAKLDRFSRVMYHVAGFTQKYAWGTNTPDLLIASSPKMTQLEIYIWAMMAEEERRQISERTKSALSVRKSQGHENGKVARTVSMNKARAKTEDAMRLATQLRGEGLGYLKIADKLNEVGLTTSKGGVWYAAGIRSRLISIGIN